MTTVDPCACKRGFFTLRDCGNAATTSCEMCSRRVCSEHLAPRVQARVCVECAARQEEGELPKGSPVVPPTKRSAAELEDATVPHRARRRYYDDWSYSPWWWASSDAYYASSGYHTRSFDDDDDDDGGFGDS
ncbi:MAG TPA: hypothetical protein VK279_04805 [Solirubrobacteraceae bacterium]|nr:hypothetical protein [Solirubrobacteraceae bacterium]